MSNEREKLQKVLTLAINPSAVEAEAIAALHRARHLVKQNPLLAHPPEQPTLPPPSIQNGSTYKVRITKIHPDWILILVGLVSRRAYDLGMKSKIAFDFSNTHTAIDMVCDGSPNACDLFGKHVNWVVEYINEQLRKTKV